ncbi:Hypothetical predicted protein [Olea europaea subsp. europaea]|uniref:Uncharacterized protein n=1 Tax=Olea europaea subsp. europaea TaxID=158383 RepID=A0A8S0RQU6_OLEEU|nr:Hypothetical predicted protein [Olea europaea subsp. europaea]
MKLNHTIHPGAEPAPGEGARPRPRVLSPPECSGMPAPPGSNSEVAGSHEPLAKSKSFKPGSSSNEFGCRSGVSRLPTSQCPFWSANSWGDFRLVTAD